MARNESQIILDMQGICESFSGVKVLNDVQFDLYSREVPLPSKIYTAETAEQGGDVPE
jgi:hypothetical protein